MQRQPQPIREIDACSLLTSGEIESVQGEPLQNTIPSKPATTAMTVSQCYFTLPTNTNSIVITLTQRGTGADAQDPHAMWERMFEGEGQRGNEREEGEKRTPPTKLDGLGDEAFWVANAVGGALYVFKGDMYLRISTGGKDQLERTKRLAQIALAKL